MAYYSNSKWARHFWSEDNNVSLMHGQPHYYRARQVEPYHWLDTVARRSSWAIEFLALCLNNSKLARSISAFIQELDHQIKQKNAIPNFLN